MHYYNWQRISKQITIIGSNRRVLQSDIRLITFQEKIFRRKRLSTGANFIQVYIEILDKGILKFNKFSQ